jgi:hypothetical protein
LQLHDTERERRKLYLVVWKLLHKLQMNERTNLVLMLGNYFYCFGQKKIPTFIYVQVVALKRAESQSVFLYEQY